MGHGISLALSLYIYIYIYILCVVYVVVVAVVVVEGGWVGLGAELGTGNSSHPIMGSSDRWVFPAVFIRH